MRLSRVSLALVALLTAGLVSGHAEVRSFNKLNINEKMALEESERRMVIYDQELRTLDQQKARKKISAENYRNETEQLTLVIREESLYQNAILVQDPQLPLRARDLLETLEHAALAVPVGIGYVIGACPQLLELFALIH
jgi:hypothetical protein